MVVLRPDTYWEFGVIKLVNLFAFALQLVGFEIMLREVVFLYKSQAAFFEEKHIYQIPEWLWVLVGYCGFIYVTLTGILGVYIDCPDGLMHGCAYFATAYLLRTTRDASLLNYLKMGCALGFGFLAKAFLFGWSFVIFALALISGTNRRKSFRHVLSGFAIFVLIIAPFVAGLSMKLHRFTYSDGASFHMAFNVYRSADYRTLKPVHPYDILMKEPLIWGFGGVYNDATFPPWYDRIYFSEGYKCIFDLEKQIVVWVINMDYYWRLFFGVLLSAYFCLVLVLGRVCLHPSLTLLRNHLLIAVPPAAGLTMYAITTNLYINDSPRYFSSLILMSLIAAFYLLAIPNTKRGRIGLGVMLIVLFAVFLQLSFVQLKEDIRVAQSTEGDHEFWKIAEGLKKLGFREGDKIACVGCANVIWTRLARLKEVSYAPNIEQFWKDYPLKWREIDAVFRKYGVKALLVPPESVTKHDMKLETAFQQVGGADCYVHLISPISN
jgi:4-amino-4-deoxy-L-arabinose transferase-like glycosyltransferase